MKPLWHSTERVWVPDPQLLEQELQSPMIQEQSALSWQADLDCAPTDCSSVDGTFAAMLLFPEALAGSFSDSLTDSLSYCSNMLPAPTSAPWPCIDDSLSVSFTVSLPLSPVSMFSKEPFHSVMLAMADMFSALSIVSAAKLQVPLLMLLLLRSVSKMSQSSISLSLLTLDIFDIMSTENTTRGSTSKIGRTNIATGELTSAQISCTRILYACSGYSWAISTEHCCSIPAPWLRGQTSN